MSELTNLVAKQNEESYQLGKKHGAIEELKKIKTEIKLLRTIPYGTMYGTEPLISQTCVLNILDKSIEELKGE